MRHFNSLLAVTVTLILSACGTMADGATQKITLATPGAYEARCTLDNGVKYQMTTGDTMDIMRSRDDLVVDCYAPGNRHQTRTILSNYNEWVAGDLVTGVLPGLAYDHFTGGLYQYPTVIVVDFVGVPKVGFEMPDYHNKDTPNPYKQSIEDYGPTTPRIENDSAYLKRGLDKRDSSVSANPFDDIKPTSGGEVAKPSEQVIPLLRTPGHTSRSSGGTVADGLTRSMNPAVFSNQ